MVFTWLPVLMMVSTVDGDPAICRLKMDVPATADTLVDGRVSLVGPGTVVIPCEEEVTVQVQVWVGERLHASRQVHLRPSKPPVKISAHTPLDPPAPVESPPPVHAPPSPAPAPAEDDLDAPLGLPAWWEASLNGQPPGQHGPGLLRRAVQLAAGVCTVGSGCGVWMGYGAALVGMILLGLAVVAAVILAVAVVVAAIASVLGRGDGEEGEQDAVDLSGCGEGCFGCLGPSSAGEENACDILGCGLPRSHPLVFPAWVGVKLVQRGMEAVARSILGSTANPDPNPAEPSAPRTPEATRTEYHVVY